MSNLDKMAEIKTQILLDIEKAERRVKIRGLGMALIEGALLITYLVIMDYHDRLHWLILVAALLTYGTITAGLVTLAGKLDLNTQRLIKALKVHETE